MDTWTIIMTDPSPAALESANAVFTISNGYMGLRGNLLEARGGRYPTTIVAGIFDQTDMLAYIRPTAEERKYLDASRFEPPQLSPAVANLPNPLAIKLYIGGREVSFRRGDIAEFVQRWNLRTGVYSYRFTWTGPDGAKVEIRQERFADMENPHRAWLRYDVTPLSGDTPVEIRSGIDATVRSNLQHWTQWDVTSASAAGGQCTLEVRTILRGHDVTLQSATRAHGLAAAGAVVEDEAVWSVFGGVVPRGEVVRVEKAIVVCTTEDARHGCEADADAELRAAETEGYEAALARNAAWWSRRWKQMDVVIEGDDAAQRYLRFCLFHLAAAAPRHSDRLSVPIKLLTGDYYQGCVFYDTDLYIHPFFLFTEPKVARTMLNFRAQSLPEARAIAGRFGYEGAKFAWQSGPYGEEVLGPWWRFTHTNIHIDGDVAYALMQYAAATGDEEFLKRPGFEILTECARFYASRVRKDEAGRYHLDDVAGPDEGHCESTDNYYTNYLARKTLLWAADIAGPSEESDRWREIADGLTFLYDANTKVYEQYDGFHALKPIPPGFREGKGFWFTVWPYQAIHQPDVVMAQTMFRDEIPDDVFRANYEHYKPRSMDFSSMSYVIHAISGRVVGDMDEAYRNFIITAGEDLDETLTGRGDVPDGLHGTATGGAWMAAVFGFGGVHLTRDRLYVDPALPRGWTRLAFPLRLRGERLDFEVTPGRVRIACGNETSLKFPARVCGRDVVLRSGEAVEV